MSYPFDFQPMRFKNHEEFMHYLNTGEEPEEKEQREKEGSVGVLAHLTASLNFVPSYAHMLMDNLFAHLTGKQPKWLSPSELYGVLVENQRSLLQSSVNLTMQSILMKTVGVTGSAVFGLLAEILNKASTGIWSASYLIRQSFSNSIQTAVGLLTAKTKEERQAILQKYGVRQAEIERETMRLYDQIDQSQLGVLGALLLYADKSLNWGLFDRKVRYVNQNGEIVETKVSGWNTEQEVNELIQRGFQVLDVEEKPHTKEIIATFTANFLDVIDPVSNMTMGGALKFVGKGTVLVNKTAKGATNNAFIKWINNSSWGQTIQNKIYRLEGELGIALASQDRGFAKLFAPLVRHYNAKIELGRRLVEGVEEYVTEGTGLVADLLEHAPKRFEVLFGEGAVNSIRNSREVFQQRVDELVRSGVSEEEAKAIAKQEWRKAQAFALWAQTGLPLSEDIVEALRKEGLTPSEADAILKQHKPNGVSETESEALRTLVSTGLINDVPTPTEAVQKYYGSPYQNQIINMVLNRSADNLTKVERILHSEEDFRSMSFEEKQAVLGLHLTDEALGALENALPMYRKDIRERLVLALSVLEQTTNPAERKAIADYITFYLSSRGVSLERLYRILSRNGEKPNVLQTLMDSVGQLKDSLKSGEASEVLETLRKAPKVDKNAIEGIGNMLKKAKEMGLGKNLSELVECIGGSFVMDAIEVLINSYEGTGTFLLRGAKSLYDEETMLRQNLLEELHAKGLSVDDIPDQELRAWLSGEIDYTQPLTAKTEAEALHLIHRVVENAGIDMNLFTSALDLQEAVKSGLVHMVRDKESRLIPRSVVDEVFQIPQSMRALLIDFAQRLEDMGRTEDSYIIKNLLDKQMDYDALVNIWNNPEQLGLSTPAIQFMQRYSQPFAMLYYLGKDYMIRDGRKVLLDALHRFSDQIYKEQSFISDEPDFIHTVRIEGTGTSLDGKFTTPYVAKVLGGLEEERTVWKGWLDFLNTVVKMSSVVWQPMALVRDFVSNNFAIMFGMGWRPDEIWKLGKYYWKALHAIRTHNEDFLRVAEQTPSVWGATAQVHELENEIAQRLASGRITERILWRLSVLPIFRDMQKMRGYSEALGKLAVVYAVEDILKGKSVNEIKKVAEDFGINPRLLNQNGNSLKVMIAEKYMLDYHDVTPAVQFLRRYLGIFPFITYETKMFSVLFSDIFSGRRLHSLGYFIRGIQNAQRSLDTISGFDSGEEEANQYREAIKNMLPKALQNDPFSVVWLDSDGRPNALSLSYYVPYGVFLPLFRIMQNPNKLEVYTKEAKDRLGGLLPPMLEVLLNIDLFTGKPIYEKDDPPDVQVRKVFTHLGKEIAPLVPRTFLNAMNDMNNLKRSPEDIEKALRLQPEEMENVDWLKRFFGVYQIKMNHAVEAEYERRIRRSQDMLRKGLEIYNNLVNRGNTLEAERMLSYYIQESNRLREEAIEFIGSAYMLRGFVGRPLQMPIEPQLDDAEREVSEGDETAGYEYDSGWEEYWKDPLTGFNPMTNYQPQIEFMRNWYQFLREGNYLPQNTTKAQLADFLIQSAEMALRLFTSLFGMTTHEIERVKEMNTQYRRKVFNYMDAFREAKTRIPIMPPTPDVPFQTLPPENYEFVSRPNTQMMRLSWRNHQLMKLLAEQMRPVKPATSGMVEQSAQAMQRNQPTNPASLGADIPSQAGRPPAGIM